MRIANFRDDVLWPVAYKLGLDPITEFLYDEGESLVSHINAWVRRTWDDRDWPEWTQTFEFTVDSNHRVAYHSIPVGKTLPVYISRPLKVFVVDPLTSPYPINTPFRLDDYGLHVGFYHGDTVWIKFLPLAPRFTSIPWDTNTTYDKGDATYSPDEGDCFVSLVHNNKANDPALGIEQPLPTEIIQEAELPNPGLVGQNQIFQAYTTPAYSPAPPTVPPPVAGTTYHMTVTTRPTNGFTTLATVSYTVTAGQTWTDVLNAIVALLVAAPGLAGFTITATPSQNRIDIEDDSDFIISEWYSTATASTTRTYLRRVQLQTYIPTVPPTSGQPQIARVTISENLLFASATYELTLIEPGGAEKSHTVEYVSVPGDTTAQILAGLAAAIDGSPDTYFEYVSVTIDPTLGTMEISTRQGVSVDATVTPESSAYWDRVLFPYALIEPVARGAYADALREAGQTDKALAEEQGAIQEDADRANKAIAPAYDSLTDQQRPAPRYKTRPSAAAPGK